MKRFLLLFALFATFASADLLQNQKVYSATNILKNFACDSAITPQTENIEQIKAIAIISGLKKTAAVASVQSGEGIFVIKQHNGEWSDPLFFDYKGLGLGIQAGYEVSDIVLLFKSSRSFKNFTDGQKTLEFNVGATFINGGGMGFSTDLPEISAHIVTSSDKRGMYFGASIDSAKFIISNQSNNDYYERIYDYEDILNGSPKDTKYTKALKDVLNKYFGNKHDFSCCEHLNEK